jgi:short-subunit dehydrogenase
MNIPALTKLFIQQQEIQNEAYILNVASTGSFVPGPFNAIYCAAKSFILSFSEALSEELEENGINVSVLCPGGTNTSFQENYDTTSGFFNPLMEPDQVAKIAIRDMFRKKRIIIPGAMNKVQTFLPRILPRKLLTTMSAKLTRPPMSKRGIVLK